MKKRLLSILCVALLCVISISFPAPAAAQTTYYPISVEEYIEDGTPRIKKVYQLSINDDPSGIPTKDFERFGYVYHLLDITQHNDEGVDAKDYTDTITQDSDTGELAEVLKQLDGQMEVTTDDGYTGLLVLDHTSIEITVKGYNTSTRNLSANRTYPNLSDADLSLIPKTVDESGRTLTLNDVQWASSYNADGSVSYTATASYTGTSTSRYATGYTVTANYRGRVSKTDCDMITYTAIFGGEEIPQEEPTPVPMPAIVTAPVEETPEPDTTPDVTVEPTPEPTPDVEVAANPGKSFVVWFPACISAICAGGSAACFIMNRKKGGKIIGGQTQQLTFWNSREQTLTVQKYIEGTTTPIEGVIFLITDSSGAVLGTNNGEFTTDRNGRIVLTGLKPGTTVTAKEIKTVSGFVLDSTPQSILIKEGEAQTLTFYNERKGGLIIEKRDSVTNQPLAGAEFKITTLDGKYVDDNEGQTSTKGVYRTDSNGQIVLTNLQPDSYVIREIKAPDGYVLTSEEQSVKRHKTSQIVLSHLAPLAVCHCCQGNGPYGAENVYLDHAAYKHQHDTQGYDRRGYTQYHRFHDQPQQLSDFHRVQLCGYVSKSGGKVHAGGSGDDTGALMDDMLSHVENPHCDVKGMRHKHDRCKSLDNPLEKNKGFKIQCVLSSRFFK